MPNVKTVQPVWSSDSPDLVRLDLPDGNSEIVDAGRLFPNQLEDEVVLHSLRLTAALSGIPDPTSTQLRDQINRARGGLKTGVGRVYLGQVVCSGGLYTVQYGPTTDSTANGYTFTPEDWTATPAGVRYLLFAASGAVRIAREESPAGGYDRLTPAVLALLNRTPLRTF